MSRVESLKLNEVFVRVIPSETNNNIDQMSSGKDILACDEGENWSVLDFFQAFNDEEVDSNTNWAFVFCLETKELIS